MVSGAQTPDARISDDWRSSDLVFSYQSIEVAEDLSSIPLIGLCKRQANTQILNWKLNEDGQTVLQGNVSCVHGNFQIDFNSIQEVPCGSPYRLVAQDPNTGSEASMNVTRRCPALQTTAESNGCAREKILTRDGQPSCEFVCYDQGIVVRKESLSLDLCPAAN